jgi:cysteine-rich repeat protein
MTVPETCDDGNAISGDGCSATCQIEPPPVCGLAPRADCRKPTAAGKASILLKDRIPDKGDLLNWKWTKGAATLKADFGSPLTTTNYTLCVYDYQGGIPRLRLRANIPAGGMCNAASPRPCWKEVTRGFKYADKDATPDGIVKFALKEGLTGGAAITLQGKGSPLDMPTLPLDQTPKIVAQIKSNTTGVCWDANYSAPALKNEQAQFRDKSDPVPTPTP